VNKRNLSLVLLLIGVAILLHQYLVWGYIWRWSDIEFAVHHETLALTSFAGAGGAWLQARRAGVG